MRRAPSIAAASLVLAIAAVFVASPARADAADPLAKVPALIDALDFAGATAAIDDALRTGALGSREVARAYVLRGVIAAARKDAPHAEREFARALRIDPTAALPVGVAPHIAAPFERARASAPAPIEACVDAPPTTASRALVAHVVVTGDPDRLARRAQLRAKGGTIDAPIAGDATDVVVDAAHHACAPLRVRLLDAFGNDLFDSGDVVVRCDAPAVPAPASAPAPREASATSRPIPGYAWAGVAVTGALAATTAVLGLIALEKRSTFEAANVDPARVADRPSLHDDALSAEHRATIAAAATAVAGAVSAVLILTRPTVATRVTLGASPLASGAAVDLAVRF